MFALFALSRLSRLSTVLSSDSPTSVTPSFEELLPRDLLRPGAYFSPKISYNSGRNLYMYLILLMTVSSLFLCILNAFGNFLLFQIAISPGKASDNLIIAGSGKS